MFGFIVKVQGDESERLGSVVTMPYVLGFSLAVTVMWDDDLTFSVHDVTELQALSPPVVEKDPDEKPEEKDAKLVNLFGDKKAALKH